MCYNQLQSISLYIITSNTSTLNFGQIFFSQYIPIIEYMVSRYTIGHFSEYHNLFFHCNVAEYAYALFAKTREANISKITLNYAVFSSDDGSRRAPLSEAPEFSHAF